jgi:hypothetical protein
LNFKISFTISPNPVVNAFRITNPFDGNAVLFIKNAAGAIVMKQIIGVYQSIIDVSRLASGIYFAKIINDQQQSDVVKFVKK